MNHLHFQAWYFNATKDGLLAIENARTKTLQTYENGITVAQVEGIVITNSFLFSGVNVNLNRISFACLGLFARRVED